MEVLTSSRKEKRLIGKAAVKGMDARKMVRRAEKCMMGERWMDLMRGGRLKISAEEG